MYSLLFLAALSFGFCFLLTPLIRDMFSRLGICDHPNSGRKTHAAPIPRVGGIPVAMACLLTFAAARLVPFEMAPGLRESLTFVWKLMPAAGVVFLTGLADDLFELRPWHKLSGQIVGTTLAYMAGVRIELIRGNHGTWWELPVTFLFLIACTNAFNLIDGVDGLASGVGFFATVTVLLTALLHGNFALAVVTIPLAGALLAFLRFNFNPASIFLGDCGSLLLGFLLGCYGVLWSQKCTTLLGMTAPLMALSIPLLDTGLSIVRRLLRHQPIFGADLGHIHHRLLARGLTPRRVALLFYGFSGLAAAFSLLQSVVDNEYGGVVIVLFCLSAWLGIQHLGYTEFGVARELLFQGTFGNMIDAHLALRAFEECLSKAGSVDECWGALRDACAEFGFESVTANLSGRTYEAHFNRGENGERWFMQVPISKSDYVKLSRAFESDVMPGILAPFVDVLRNTMRDKLTSPLPAGAPGEPGLAMAAGRGREPLESL